MIHSKFNKQLFIKGFFKKFIGISKMGFTASPQGRPPHEALMKRQDAEVKMLDTVKRCLAQKIKYDRDYAQCLLTTVVQGQLIEYAEDLSGSVVVEAWKSLMEEFEFTAKHIIKNSETLESKVFDKLNSLCSEKKKCMKLYQDDHSRLSFQLNKFIDEVSRKKLEYQKNVENYKTCKLRLEEFNKGGTRSNKKFEELKEKYQRACKRLHQTHNEYVLLLTEAVEFEHDYRNVLIPELLQSQLRAQEELVKPFKIILEDIWKYSSLCTEQLQDLGRLVKGVIENVKPDKEYTSFNDKHKNNVLNGTLFNFDDNLLKDDVIKLKQNEITVDSLTVDWLRTKLSDLESKINEEYNRKLQLSESLASTGRTPDTIKKQSSSEYTFKKLELTEARCIEKKLKKQFDIIKTALSDFTSDELPSGCELDIQEAVDHEMSTQSKAIVDEEWFHGVLPREEVVRLLTREGDFLVRETMRNEETQTVLSVAWGGHKHFIVQTTPEGYYRFEGRAFPTIQELIVYQWHSGIPVTARSGAILRKPIYRERWELNNDDVLLIDKIGRGNFGDVYRAKLKSTNEEVAVKTCRVALADEHKRKFLQEGRILKQYDHPNIVKLIGICVQKQPIMIVMELVPGGSLLTFLRNNRLALSQAKLLKMCKDTAAGMRYLESRNCIHRDLAARNCLIGYEDIVKISDFGMSREEEEYIVSDGMKQIPIKWTAPEALNFGKYTSLCDVWSYGILTWEIFSTGDVPYAGMSNTKTREEIDKGFRMPSPDGCPDEMYQLMRKCWEYQPEERPHFDEIHSILCRLYSQLYPNLK